MTIKTISYQEKKVGEVFDSLRPGDYFVFAVVAQHIKRPSLFLVISETVSPIDLTDEYNYNAVNVSTGELREVDPTEEIVKCETIEIVAVSHKVGIV